MHHVYGEEGCMNLLLFIHIFLDILIVYICKVYGFNVVIPLSPDSEQHQLSPNNIDTYSREKVIRI